MRADLFELANVRLLLFFGGKQRPYLRDFFAPDVKKSGTLRRVQPLVQAGSEVVAVQIRLLEIKLRKRMRAVDDGLNAARPRHFTDGLHGRDLAGDVHLVRDLNQPRARGDGSLERRGNLVDVLGRNRDFDRVELDAFA